MKNMEYMLLENEAVARKFLYQKYQSLERKTLVYRNVHAFTSYIKQGNSFFHTAENSDFWSKPLLLYYGMMSLLKAFALSVDCQYPQSTSVLQHGLTSPKRKKEPYRFYQDEIRVQKDGFFPYLCKLLNYPIATGQRYKMEILCAFIPDLQPLSKRLNQKCYLWPIQHEKGKITCPIGLLDALCVSAESFVNRLNQGKPLVHFSLHQIASNSFTLDYDHDILQHPWVFPNDYGDLFLWVQDIPSIQPLPEILAHYGLLFSLSMLCRYDPPVWRELYNDTEIEQLIIQELVCIIQSRFPKLVLQLLAWE